MNKETFDIVLKGIVEEETNKARKTIFDRSREEVSKLFKIGDIIEDHSGFGKIEDIKIGVASYGNFGEVGVYFECQNLTKQKKPSRRDPRRVIYLDNLKWKGESMGKLIESDQYGEFEQDQIEKGLLKNLENGKF